MKVLGFTDNCTNCEKCGKSNLKGTYVVIDENNNDHYYGSECVKKATGNIAPNKNQAKNILKQFILSRAHNDASISNNYDLAMNLALNRLNERYKTNIKW